MFFEAVVHSHRLLPQHFLRILILPDSEKDLLPETVIPRPLCEFYLADHHRLDPMATLHLSSSQPLVPTAPARCRDVEKGTGSTWIFCSSEKRVLRSLSLKPVPTLPANLNFLPS